MLLELAALLPDLEMVLALVSPWVPEGLDQQGSLFASPRRPSCGVAGCSCEHALPQACLLILIVRCSTYLVTNPRRTNLACDAAQNWVA